MAASHSFWKSCNMLGTLVPVAGRGRTLRFTKIAQKSDCVLWARLSVGGTLEGKKIVGIESLASDGAATIIGSQILLDEALLENMPGRARNHRLLSLLSRHCGKLN